MTEFRSGVLEYIAITHAITFDFGTHRGSVSKTEYYVNLIR